MKLYITMFCMLLTKYVFCQNVGINTNNPQGQLHIETNSSLSKPQLRLTELGYDYSRLKMENTIHHGTYWDIAGLTDTIAESAKLNFYFSSPNSTGNHMTILGNGNIGIGINNPTAKLDIRSVGNGSEVLKLNTERPWVFKQTGSSFQSKLTLQSTYGDKQFEIVSVDSSTVSASFKASDNFPGVFLIPTLGRVGVGTFNPNARMSIEGSRESSENILRVNVNRIATSDIVGVDCSSYPSTGYGIGAIFKGGHRGLRGISEPGNSSRLSIGVVGATIGTGGVGERVGLWGNATGGQTNWAGYFDNGNVYVRNELRIGSGAFSGATGYKVAIDGKIIAEEIRVQLSGAWPDYVFEDTYELMPLNELEASIENNNHLPGIPSAATVENEGIAVGEMQTAMMEKIEELTLYVIALNKELQSVKKELQTYKHK